MIEDYLISLIKKDVISHFKNIYHQWSDTDVEEEVQKRLYSFTLDLYTNYKERHPS